MSISVYKAWLRDAPKGETCTYYRGFLGRDRASSWSNGQKNKIADLMLEYSGQIQRTGRPASKPRCVVLLQRRHGEDDYSYIAVKTGDRV